MSIWNKSIKLLFHVSLACCGAALTVLLSKYFGREQTKVIFFNGSQKSCGSHFNLESASKLFKNSECSICKVEEIVNWLKQAKKTLDVCIYMINQETFTNALLDAQKRGVLVRVIINVDTEGSSWKLGINGIAKRCKPWKNTDNLMHHKFIILDNKKIILGSLNLTDAAIRQNWENIFITNKQEIIEPFIQEFERLWKTFS